MKRKSLLLGFFLTAGLVLGAGSLTHRVFADEGGPHSHHAAFFQRMLGKHLDEALDAAKVSDAQRAQIQQIREATTQTITAAMQQQAGSGGQMNGFLNLFTADRIDPQQLTALRTEREATMKQVGDAVDQAIVKIHDILTPAQRQAVAEYVRSHHPMGPHGRRAPQ